MILEGIAQRTIRKMNEEGKVTVVSQEITNKINYEIGEIMTKARKEFEKLERNSRYYIALVESGMINYMGKRNYFT